MAGLPRTVGQALRRAANTSSWQPGMCANFVASMYGAVGLGGYESAIDQWRSIPSNLHNNGTDAPPGALVFWGGGYGHVAISAGGGYVYTTDFDGRGTVSLVKASDITEQWGKPVLGWSQPYWGGHTIKVEGGAGDPPANARESSSNGGGGDNMHRSDFGFDPQFLDDHPEVSHLVDKAIRNEWSVTRFQAELKQTDWWQDHTKAQRQYQVLLSEDPAQAADVLKDNEAQIRALATQLGVDLSNKEINDLAEKAARNAWTSTEMQMAVGRHFSMGRKDESLTGVASTTVYDLRQMAHDQGVPISRKRLSNWTEDILQGKTTVEGYAQILRDQAKALYPHLSQQIDQTGSLRAWADPYLQMAGQMLGVNPDSVRLDKGKWSQLMNPVTGGQGNTRPPTMDEWARTLRSDERFGFDATDGAQEAASDLTLQLGRMMGVV